MFARVFGAVAVPGMFVVVTTIVAAAIRARDLPRRDSTAVSVASSAARV